MDVQITLAKVPDVPFSAMSSLANASPSPPRSLR